MNDVIQEIKPREILDSRGFPTVEVEVILESGIIGRASIPSGASTGKKEALELRDQEPNRFHGKGVTKAVNHITDEIEPELIGWDVFAQHEIDQKLIELDGSENKSKLGANAILGVSLAVARAASLSLEIPLFEYLGGKQANCLPIPMLNVINGGMHADNNIDIQEFMLVPYGFVSFKDGLRAGAEIYQTLKKILQSKKLSTAIGDEGGFAPNLATNREALELLVQAIGDTGYIPGKQVSISLDCAASSYFKEEQNQYTLHELGEIDYHQLMSYYTDLCQHFPIYSIEDPFDEADEKAWTAFTKEKGDTLPIVGDDIFVTNPVRLTNGITNKIANTILIKVNQIGTLSETIETIHIANNANYGFIISHRSGETEDSFIADLAVAMGGGHIKTGAPCRSERLAKYNQLLRIEEMIGFRAVYGKKWKGR